MPLVEPDNLSEVLKSYISAQFYNGLYTVSMDHSPSEQLSGTGWHTTVLVLSAGVEHAQLARDIARTLRPRVGKLTKWSKARPRYQDMFPGELARYLPKYPVYILAVSATASAIRQSEKHFLNELLLTDRYHRTTNVKGSVSVTLGPFWSGQNREKVMVKLHERRALMCLFISHFVLRMHRDMHQAVTALAGGAPTCMNWNFYGDKFPGPPNQDMDLMFQVLASLARPRGRIVWGYFVKGDAVEIDLLADNLAGLLNNTVGRPSACNALSLSSPPPGGLFYWEQWRDS